MYPTLEAVMEIAAEGSYGRIPVAEEMYADRFTPVEVMRTLRAASRHCYLLESAENNQKWGRYSFMGYSPVMEITCNDGEMTVTTGAEDGCKEKRVIKTRHPKKAVREILKKYKSPRLPDMPNFTGGLVGYFSYDYIRYAEPTLQNNGW